MCGIVGYRGTEQALPIIATGLKNLEYRGYDSAGIALHADGLQVFKQSGDIDGLNLPSEVPATIGIGHTRWSTHGKPTNENAHPHCDCTGDIAVVHNGIIENYDALKAELLEDGHVFLSETDTEVIPHLIEKHYHDGKPLSDAVQETVDRLAGTFAIGVIASDSDELIAARQDSPLILGHSDTGRFIASDVTAFLELTRRVSYLEDGDIAILGPDHVTILNDGQEVDRPIQTVEWEADAAEKGGYDHYMLKEIHEQPRALRQTLSGRIDELAGEPALDVSLPEEYLQSLEEIQIVACGTSYHAGLYAKQVLEPHADVRVSVDVASEYTFQGGRDPWRTLVIAITQSGETADTLAAVRDASRAGARTLAVTNTLGSTVTREVDDTIFIRAGPEIGVAATKTFVSQVATLMLLTVYIGQQRGTISPQVTEEILTNLRKLPGTVQQVLDYSDLVREAAGKYANATAFFFIGRKLGMPVALEGALKLKEISYDHAEGFPAGELKHGPLALVTPDTPVLAVLTTGSRPSSTLNNVKEVESRGAPVIGVTSMTDTEKYLDTVFEVPRLGLLEPLVANVYLQLFAYHIARQKDRPIDKPRNLAKSVTVE